MFNKKFLIAAVFMVFFLVFFAWAEESKGLPRLLVFQSPGCSRCFDVKRELLPAIEKEYKGKIAIEYYDLTDINNHHLLLGLRKSYGSSIELSLPVFFMQGSFLNGKSDLENTLRIFIEGGLAEVSHKPDVAGIDLVEYFKGIKPLTILGSGLIDGVNPCAFTVIVFFISYLAFQGYRKRELVAIGLSFITAVFLTYVLIGLGVFNFLYHMDFFWFFAKAFNIAVGVFCILLGLLSLYDFFKFRKTGDTERVILQLPKSVKAKIHAIIGMHYRKGREGREALGKVSLPRLVLSALITGFLVSILEAVCTGQLYLPTIAYVLKTTPLKLQAFWYLIGYNIMFILPLLAVFTMALFGVTSGEFSAYFKKRFSTVKIIMAVVFFGLGILLIWRG